MPIKQDNMLDLQIIDENGKTIPYETISIERVYIDEDGEEDSDFLEPAWIEEKEVHRIYWNFENELQDENGSLLKEAKLRIEVEGYDEPKIINVKYPKRNTKKTVKFKHPKKK